MVALCKANLFERATCSIHCILLRNDKLRL